MLSDHLEYLRLFIKKADELKKLSYFSKQNSIVSFVISKEDDGRSSIIFNYPNDEQTKALLLTLRMFWQKNDFIYYRKFLDFFLEMPFSKKWKFEVEDIIRILDFQFDFPAIEGKENFSKKNLFEIFLYGDHAHFSKRTKFINLTSDPFLKKLNEESFHESIIDFSSAIISLANITRRALRKLNILVNVPEN